MTSLHLGLRIRFNHTLLQVSYKKKIIPAIFMNLRTGTWSLFRKVIGMRWAYSKVFTGRQATKGFEFIDHVRLVIISAVICQLCQVVVLLMLFKIEHILKANHPQKLLWRHSNESFELPFILFSAQAGAIRQFCGLDISEPSVDQLQAIRKAG